MNSPELPAQESLEVWTNLTDQVLHDMGGSWTREPTHYGTDDQRAPIEAV
jgi:hypothetical protein